MRNLHSFCQGRRVDFAEVEPCDDERLARALLSIQHAAYAVEAAIIGDDRIPALHETLDELRKAPLRWLAVFDNGRPVGALARSEDSSEVDIDRLIVSPAVHRRGIGKALVRKVLAIAEHRRTIVSTGRANRPARALYEGLGFEVVGEKEVIPRLWITQYVHTPIAAGAN